MVWMVWIGMPQASVVCRGVVMVYGLVRYGMVWYNKIR